MADQISVPWDQTHFYSFAGPDVVISCDVDYDRERECYLATSAEGFRATGGTAMAAALNCFRAWVTQDSAWFEATP